MSEKKSRKIIMALSVGSLLFSLLIPGLFTNSFAQTKRVSDELLLARAINGEERGVPYE